MKGRSQVTLGKPIKKDDNKYSRQVNQLKNEIKDLKNMLLNTYDKEKQKTKAKSSQKKNRVGGKNDQK